MYYYYNNNYKPSDDVKSGESNTTSTGILYIKMECQAMPTTPYRCEDCEPSINKNNMNEAFKRAESYNKPRLKKKNGSS